MVGSVGFGSGGGCSAGFGDSSFFGFGEIGALGDMGALGLGGGGVKDRPPDLGDGAPRAVKRGELRVGDNVRPWVCRLRADPRGVPSDGNTDTDDKEGTPNDVVDAVPLADAVAIVGNCCPTASATTGESLILAGGGASSVTRARRGIGGGGGISSIEEEGAADDWSGMDDDVNAMSVSSSDAVRINDGSLLLLLLLLSVLFGRGDVRLGELL
jgi:hypothetical protein